MRRRQGDQNFNEKGLFIGWGKPHLDAETVLGIDAASVLEEFSDRWVSQLFCSVPLLFHPSNHKP